MHSSIAVARVVVVVGAVVGVVGIVGGVGAGCEIARPVAGKACAGADDCGTGFFCQLEVAPHVCIPGDLGVPPPSHHAPVYLRAAVVSIVDDDVIDTGNFVARDPDGDAVTFTAAEEDGPLG